MNARYGHTNLVARDWRRLAGFYIRPVRLRAGATRARLPRLPTLEAGTGVPDSGLRGIHLRLPGHGEEGPTLEIYAYDREGKVLPPAATHRPGLGTHRLRGR